MVRNATVATAAPGPRASPTAASRAETPTAPAIRPPARRGGEDACDGESRPQPRGDREAGGAGTPSPVRARADPRRRRRREARHRPRASASDRDEVEQPWSRAPSRCGSETVIHTSAAAATAVAAASASPRGERTLSLEHIGRPERRRGSRGQHRDGDPERATRRRTPATATAVLSTPPRSASCQRRAPNHVRRRRAGSRSRRIPRAASTVKASSSAAPSPPTRRRRVSRDVRGALRCAQLLDRRVDVEGRRMRRRARPSRAPSGRGGRPCSTGAGPGVHRPHPGSTCDTCARARERRPARHAPPRRRAAPGRGRWYSAP